MCDSHKRENVLDLQVFRDQSIAVPGERTSRLPTKSEPFIKGPMSLKWFQVAARQPGKVLAVGLALWYKAGLTCSTSFKTTGKLWKTFGVSRPAVYFALAALESQGLIKVDRNRGQNPLVTILDD